MILGSVSCLGHKPILNNPTLISTIDAARVRYSHERRCHHQAGPRFYHDPDPGTGRELMTVETEDQVLFAIEKIIDWVYRRAWSGRLLSEQLDELHFGKFREEILKQVPEAGAAGPVKS